MVSENLFNDVLIPAEQKTLPKILKPGTNFSPKEDLFTSEMAQVDVSIPESSTLFPQSQNDVFRNTTNDINKNENVITDNKLINNIKEEDDISSDIELHVESTDRENESESDEKSKNNTFVEKKQLQNNVDNKLPVNKDIESVESLDNDLSNTANLVGKSFLQDDFDSLDYLGDDNSPLSRVVVESTPKNHDVLSKCNSKADNVDDQEHSLLHEPCEELQACESEIIPINNLNVSEESLNENELTLKECDVEEKSSANIENDSQTRETISEVTLISTEKTDQITDETILNDRQTNVIPDAPIDVDKHSENLCGNENQADLIIAKTDSLETPSNDCTSSALGAEIEHSSSMQNHELKPTSNESGKDEETNESLTHQRMDIEEKSCASVAETEKNQALETDDSQITPPEVPNEAEIIDSDSQNPTIPEAPSLPSKESNLPEKDITQSDENPPSQIDGEDSTLTKKSSSDDILPVDEATRNSENQDNSSPVDALEAVDQGENEVDKNSSSTTNLSETNVEVEIIDDLEKTQLPLASTSEDVIEKNTTVSSPTVDIAVSPPRNDSPLSCHDNEDLNNEPKSVECTELFIDLVDPEVVDIDDTDEPMEVSENLREKATELFKNTAEEIASCDMIAEFSVKDNSTDNQKCDLLDITCEGDSIIIAGTQSTHPEIHLNRHNASNLDNRKRKIETSDISDCSEKRTKCDADDGNVTNAAETKKRSAINTARKHTSSTNINKTLKEIENKIKENCTDLTASKEPISQTFDINDFVVNESIGGSVQLNHCDVAIPPTRDETPKIDLRLEAISKDNLKSIFSHLRTKLTRRQLEEIVLQKCCEVMADSSEIGELRRQVNELQQAEFYRKQKILNLEKQLSQLKAVCQKYLEQTKENKSERLITPIVITRSVGLQVAIESTPHVVPELPSSNGKGEERLKKLLTSSSTSKKTLSENSQSSPAPRSQSNNTTLVNPSINGRKKESKVLNNNYSNMNGRVSSPLNNAPAPSVSPLPNSSKNNAILLKKVAKTVDSNSTVIDLTDKDDRNDIESSGTTKNLLGSVNGTVLTYVPVTMNHDQNRQVLKHGTPILLNGQLMTVKSKTYSPLGGNNKHPAPVPDTPPLVTRPGWKPLPPRPQLKISKNATGIMLSWNMPTNISYSTVSKYQLYAYQEIDVPPSTDLWKEVGEVDALPLPMACTLTQFQEGHRYHFIVRAVDIHGRFGPFSFIESILL